MSAAIVTEKLSKQFERPAGWRRLARQAGTAAVRDVSLQVAEGELFGLLGPNGAGKTTLVKMLCTLIRPSAGEATVAGYPLSQAGAIRSAVGLVVTDERSFYWRLSGWQNLEFFAAMHRLHGAEAKRRVAEVLEQVGLERWSAERVSNYSSGMRQRLAIARSLLHGPRILFLDEPTRSLDPTGTAKLHELLHDLKQTQGVTIFLITHDLAEAEKLCSRVALMHQGRLRVTGTLVELRQELAPQQRYLIRVAKAQPETLTALGQTVPGLSVETDGEWQQLRFAAAEKDGILDTVLDCLRSNGATIRSIEGSAPTMEEIFAHYTGTERDG